MSVGVTLPAMMINRMREAIVDQLRSCSTPEQLLALDEQIRVETDAGPLYRVICNFLRDRTVAPVEAAIWLGTLMDHREKQLDDCLNLHCQL
ncbi:MAG TPA: hypothetical protein QF700_11870 [Prochlorococcus sp.]|mgnify:FL=1|nr:hypothetical protein [Prochlorococcus sp.]